MKFKVGQRVIYTSPENYKNESWFHAVSMGGDEVMHLNARDEKGKIKSITGTVIAIKAYNQLETWYDIAPDGWILSESGWPRGFGCAENELRALNDPDFTLPGTITDRRGIPIDE